MSAVPQPRIIFIPGLLPKPAPDVHREALLHCLLAGVGRIDENVAGAIGSTPGAFDIVSWTYDFYHEHRDFGIDAAAVDAVIERRVASSRDIAEANSWRRRIARWVYTLGDLLPVLIPHVANENMAMHLRDLRRYLRDDNGIAAHTRRMLKVALRSASEGGRPVLLLAHSMGSVIAFDSLWELSHSGDSCARVDMLVTMGSPLGQRYLQRRLKGADRHGKDRYPDNVGAWTNISAVGDLTALDPDLADDFEEMLELGLLEEFRDEMIHTHFRLDGELNVHSEYGYLVNETTARTVVEWWRAHS